TRKKSSNDKVCVIFHPIEDELPETGEVVVVYVYVNLRGSIECFQEGIVHYLLVFAQFIQQQQHPIPFVHLVAPHKESLAGNGVDDTALLKVSITFLYCI